MRGYPVDHVGLAVSFIEKAPSLFEGLTAAPGTSVAGLFIELVEEGAGHV